MNEKRFDDMCADFLPKGDVEECHPDYPSYELERELGRKMLDGVMLADEAYDELY